MKKGISLSVFIFALVVAIICSATVTFCIMSTSNSIKTANNQDRFSKLYEVVNAFDKLYVGDIDEDAVINGAIEGYLYAAGDKYAEHFTEEELAEFNSEMEGIYTGIGVSVIYNTDYKAIEIINVMRNTPALEADLRVGDIIYGLGTLESYEKVSDIGYEPTIYRIKSGDEGTIVDLVVIRDGKYLEFHIARKQVVEESVLYHVYANDSKIGIIAITGFNMSTVTQFVNAVDDLLNNKGCEYLVFDVRNNPGGVLDSICYVLDYLLPEGPIVRSVDKQGKEQVLWKSKASCLDVPMAVLCNGSTASAAELFTAALKDYKVATIVGTQTYGKGCMQTTVRLPSGDALKVTYRMYNPPFSDNYDGVGVAPDVVVELDEEYRNININKLTDQTDNQLQAACEAVKNR